VIKTEFTTLEDFLTGSYHRNTMILPLKDADVDVMIVLNPSYHGKYGPTALLDRGAVLLKPYTTPKISRSGQAVTITFSDFKVDVVVGYKRKGGGYLIVSSYDGYLSTNPKKHVEQSSASNSAQNGTGTR
jgi:tRNA nucleotidyltransferase (CCA-adding enzyme)